MEFRGVFENGVVKPGGPVNLPEGTVVEFQEAGKVDGTPLSRGSPTSLAELERIDRATREGASVNDLASRANVRPLRSIDELGGVWPDDQDDVDEFLRSVKEGRR